MFELTHLIKDPASSKSSNPSCLDNFYANKKTIIFDSSTVETGISNHHSLIYTVFCSTSCKGAAKFIHIRYHNDYNNKCFKTEISQLK